MIAQHLQFGDIAVGRVPGQIVGARGPPAAGLVVQDDLTVGCEPRIGAHVDFAGSRATVQDDDRGPARFAVDPVVDGAVRSRRHAFALRRRVDVPLGHIGTGHRGLCPAESRHSGGGEHAHGKGATIEDHGRDSTFRDRRTWFAAGPHGALSSDRRRPSRIAIPKSFASIRICPIPASVGDLRDEAIEPAGRGLIVERRSQRGSSAATCVRRAIRQVARWYRRHTLSRASIGSAFHVAPPPPACAEDAAPGRRCCDRKCRRGAA